MAKKIAIDKIKNKTLWDLMNEREIYEAVELAKKIYPLINWYNPGDANAKSDTQEKIDYNKNVGTASKQILKNLYNTPESIPTEYLIAYSKFFGVSTDFILCRSDFTSPENDFVGNYTGLSNESIEKLKSYSGNERLIIDKLFSSGAVSEIVNAVMEYNICYFHDIIIKRMGYSVQLSDKEKQQYFEYIAVDYMKKALNIMTKEDEIFYSLNETNNILLWNSAVDLIIQNTMEQDKINELKKFSKQERIPNETKQYIEEQIKLLKAKLQN